MASIGDTTRPAFAYDQATDTWVPVGIGPHSHTPAAIGAISSSLVTAKGDLIVATGSGVVVAQPVGANNQVLMADSAQTDGVKWANEATATLTTTGDILYASAANTPARLGIGSSGQILSVSGGVPAWAAAPSAGANWSLLSSTSLSGSTTTVSGISGKDKIMIFINGASSNTGNAGINVRLNTDTTSNYNFFGPRWNAPSTYSASFLSSYGPGGADNVIKIGNIGSSAGSLVSGYCSLTGCNASGVKIFMATGSGSSGGALQEAYAYGGYYNSSSTISSISVFCDTGTFDAGTVLVYTSA